MPAWRRIDITGMKCYIVAQNGCSYASPTSDAQDSSENSPTPSSALYPNTTMRYTPKPTDVVYGLLFILVVLFLLYIGYYAARPRRVVHKEQAWANENGKKNIDDVEEKEEEIVSTPQTQTPHTPEPEITSVKGGSAPLKGDEVDTEANYTTHGNPPIADLVKDDVGPHRRYYSL